MKAQLIRLVDLQAVDTRLKSIEAERDTLFSRQRSLQADVDKLRTEFKTVNGRLEELEKEKRAKELELATDRDKLKKWEGRLEDLRNSREFAALGREVEGLKRAINDTQERILTLMGELEEQNKKMRDVEQRLSTHEQALKQEKDTARDALAAKEAEVAKERESRQRIAGQLPANVMKRYEQLLTKRAGLAVVSAANGNCKGCNMGLPPQLYIRVQRAETLETCPACGRMLFHDSVVARDVLAENARPG